jgi:hypothetical protein
MKHKPVHQFLTFVGNDLVDRAKVRHPHQGHMRFMGKAEETPAWEALPYEVAREIEQRMRDIILDRLRAVYGKKLTLRLDREYVSHPEQDQYFAQHYHGDWNEGIQPRP